MNDVFFALWFFLPAGVANVTPIFASKIPFLRKWNFPIDFFQTLKGKRIFGDHKTARGFITGIILGTLTSILIFQISIHMPYAINHLPNWYFQTNPVILGLLLSTGALTGDAIKSFFKRRIGIQPGKTWIPFDQIDYIVGGIFFSSFLHVLSIKDYFIILVVWVVIHLLSTYSGYFLRLKDQPI